MVADEARDTRIRDFRGTRRTVAYCRVSTEDQATDGYSMDDQQRACRLYAEARAAMQDSGWTAIDDGTGFYLDPGVSGATRDRPGLNRLLADARAGKIGRVICTKLDRMGRRAADILAIEDELEQCGVERVYIKDSIDTSTATGRLLRTVLAAVAELERDMILERTRAGALEKARSGSVQRARGIYGYRYIPVNKSTGENGRLEIDPETAPIVRRIFEDIASGVTSCALARNLTAEGVPTYRGAKVWWETTVRQIIYNSAYMGKATHGRLRTVKENGKTKQRKNDPANVIYIDVPPIVSPGLAQAAQARLQSNKTFSKRNAKHEYLLNGGILQCGVLDEEGKPCGHTMTGYMATSKKHRRYRCVHMTETGRKAHHSVSADAVEEAIWGKICETLADPGVVLSEVKKLSDKSSAQATALLADIDQAERGLEAVGSEADRLLDLYLKDKVDEARYTAKSDELATRKRALEDRVMELTARRDAALAHRLPLEGVEEACQRVARGTSQMTLDERRDVVRTFCLSIYTTREEATIEADLSAFKSRVALDEDGDIENTTGPRYGAPPRGRPRSRG